MAEEAQTEKKKGKHLADLKTTPNGLEQIQPPQPQRQQVGVKEIGEGVWSTLVEQMSKDTSLNDKDFIKKYLRNRRRIALRGIVDAMLTHAVAVEDMAVMCLRFKNSERAEAIRTQKTQEVDSCLRVIESWEMELKAVVAISKSLEYEKKIEEIYGDTDLSTDNETTS